jgi:formylglycine-generating enzyme required for sulfatase activity
MWFLCMAGFMLAMVVSRPALSDSNSDGQQSTAAPPAAPPKAADEPKAYDQTLPETTVSFKMVPVPGDGKDINPFYMSATEVTWDAYDLYAFANDTPDAGSPKGADAVTGPSKPYLPPDRGFGHAGYAVLSTAQNAANRFCEWLSEKTGHKYRLPTEAEWAHACALNSEGAPPMDEFAWHAGNSEEKTHPVATKKPGALGLYDMCGNTAEWVVAADSKPTAMGGSFKDDAAAIGCAAVQKQAKSWQASDPQLPKSKWWLSDCSWVSFRVVREIE